MTTVLITNGTLTRSRRGAGAFVQGVWVPAAAATATTTASMQPDNGAIARARESGDRQMFAVKVHVPHTFSLRGVDQYGSEEADRITHTAFPGDTFLVTEVRDYSAFASIMPETAHLEARAVRLDEAVKGTT